MIDNDIEIRRNSHAHTHTEENPLCYVSCRDVIDTHVVLVDVEIGPV